MTLAILVIMCMTISVYVNNYMTPTAHNARLAGVQGDGRR